jgi:hypothetical protein
VIAGSARHVRLVLDGAVTALLSAAAAAEWSPAAIVDAVLERITYANEETGYTIRVGTDRSATDLLPVVGSLLGVRREGHATNQPVEQAVREPERLTDREAEILRLIPETAVADRAEVSLSECTIHKHLGKIYRNTESSTSPVVPRRLWWRGRPGLFGDEPESVADPVAEPSPDDVPDLDVVGTAEQELAASRR